MSEGWFALIGVFLGAILTVLFEWLKERKTQTKNAHYLVIRLIPILDQYLDSCLDVVGDDGTAYGQPAGGDGSFSEQKPTPEKLTFPDDVEWKSIEQDLLKKIMLLPNEAYLAGRAVQNEIDEPNADSDYGEVIAVRRYQYAHLSIKCYDLLQELRKKYNIEARLYPNEWEPRDYCNIYIKKFEEIQKINVEAHAKTWEEMTKLLTSEQEKK
jgi:hypothetical protein